MKKMFRSFALLMMGASLFVACSSDDKDDVLPGPERPEVITPEATEAQAKEEIANVVKALKEINGELNGADVSEFIAALEASDVTAKTNEFTVFAVEDEVEFVFDEPADNARSFAARGRNIDMNYHILAGKIDVQHLGADKDYVYKTINGKDVMISKRNNVVYVNGVAMKKNEFFGNKHGKGSHIYCVKNPVPEKTESMNSEANKKGAYDLRVMNIVNGRLAPSKDALVMAFEMDGYKQTLIAKVRANDDGRATIVYHGNKPVFYKAVNRQYSYIYNGFMVAGIYTSENIASALPYENVIIKGKEYQPIEGGVMLADTNGDGKINYQDRQGKKFLELKKGEELNTIYLADKSK